MRKTFSIVLMSIIFLHIGGGYLYFVARLSAIRMEIRHQLSALPDQELTRILLTREDFNKAKVDDHEVKLNGKLYDIARIEWNTDTVLVFAKHDQAEDNLLSFLQEMLHQSSNDKNQVPVQLIQLITLHFILFENQLPLNSCVFIAHRSSYEVNVFNCSLRIESPPPRI